jgi:micrococcal nuclease
MWFRVLEYRVIDGDSIECRLDLGLDISVVEVVRLLGVDAPEVRTKDPEIKKAGIAAKEWMDEELHFAADIFVLSQKFQRGKYGRILGYIYADNENLNDKIIEHGYAVPYE